jgi:hypothetical protein
MDRRVAGYGSWPLVRRWALGFEKGGVVQDVYIRFLDGGTIRFRARGFDVNVGGRLPSEAKPKRFTYTDSNGREAPIYLRLDQVVAIIVTPAGTSTSEGGPSRAPESRAPESRAPELGELRL